MKRIKLYKFNPLIHWSYNEMLDYIKEHNVPYNPLHDKGFVSIGCAPAPVPLSRAKTPLRTLVVGDL